MTQDIRWIQEYLSFGNYILKHDDWVVRRKPGNRDYQVERRNVVVGYGFKKESDAVRYAEGKIGAK